jgi:hypothetical protein
MRALRGLFAGFLCLGLAIAHADEGVPVCFNYGCASEAVVLFAESRLAAIDRQLGKARTAADERERLSLAVGQLYAWAGEQTPIKADRAGNVADGGVYGEMDCIDHSTTTTRFLRLLERRGALHFHHVQESARRGWIFQHYTAVIEENLPSVMLQADVLSARWAIDSWYVDNGRPALVLPLKEWFDYWSPDA